MHNDLESFPAEYSVSTAKQQSAQVAAAQQSAAAYAYEQVQDGSTSYPPLTQSPLAPYSIANSSHRSDALAQSLSGSLLDPAAAEMHAQHRKAIRQWGWRVKGCFALHLVRRCELQMQTAGDSGVNGSRSAVGVIFASVDSHCQLRCCLLVMRTCQVAALCLLRSYYCQCMKSGAASISECRRCTKALVASLSTHLESHGWSSLRVVCVCFIVGFTTVIGVVLLIGILLFAYSIKLRQTHVSARVQRTLRPMCTNAGWTLVDRSRL